MSADDRLFDVDYGLREHQRTRLINLTGKARADHPDTSREAARLIAPRSGSQRAEVLSMFARDLDVVRHRWIEADDEGLTDEEIQTSLPNLNPSAQRPRRVELVEMGWLRDSGRRRKTRSGHDAVVWVLTQRGREAL